MSEQSVAPVRPDLVQRALGVLPALLVVGTTVVVIIQAAHHLTNDDTYFHLRFGHEFLTGAWSLQHPGSVTTLATRRWVPTEWLPEVVMAQLENWFGLAGVAWFSGLQFCFLVGALILSCRSRATLLVAAPVTALALFVCAPGLSPRPQVISYAFVAITAAAWLATRDDGKARWWLVPMTWVWAMYHGMWPLGLVLGFACAMGVALDRKPSRREVVKLFSVPVASAVVAALTPVGPTLYAAVVTVSSRGKFFSEWGPPKFTDPNVMCLGVMIAVALLILLRRQQSWTMIALVLLICAMGVYSARTVETAGTAAAVVLAEALRPLVRPGPAWGRRTALGVVGTLVAGLVVLGFVVPHTAAKPESQPAWAVKALAGLPQGTVLLNDWDFGGLLMWRDPQLNLVMHGYGDTFTTAQLIANTDMSAAAGNWQGDVRRTGARLAFLKSDSSLSAALEDQAGWLVVRRDKHVVLLKAPPGWQ